MFIKNGGSPGSGKMNIIPIYKNGSKEEPLNYTPVSLTSIVCKVCERVIKKQWIEYLERGNNIREAILAWEGTIMLQIR